MPRRLRRSGAALVFATDLGLAAAGGLGGPARSSAQDSPAPAVDAKGAKAAWAAVFERQARDYRIAPEGGGEPARLLDRPVLRWSQPVRGTDDGAVFLWLRDGRPEAAGSIFTMKDNDGRGGRDLVHEFHSLAPHPVSALWRGEPAWDCPTEGVRRTPVAGAEPPAAAAPARLRQMQALAREFSARSIDRRGGPWELRLLSKPLYRYEGAGPDLIDGALFAFAQGTDPEVLLLLEATAEGAPRWQFALASFTDLGLDVRHKSVQVYTEPVATQLEGRHGPHVGFRVGRGIGDRPEDYDRPDAPR